MRLYIKMLAAFTTAAIPALAVKFGPSDLFQDAPYTTNIETKLYSTAAFGDCNNDGFLDIAVTTCGDNNCLQGALYLYINDPLNPGSFSVRNILTTNGPARQLAWGDFDNDGDLDLYANAAGGSSQFLFQNSGAAGNYQLSLVTGGGSDNSNNVLPGNSNVQGAGWIDANQDGWLDLFVSNGSGGSSKLYLNKGANSQTNPNWFQPSNAVNWFQKFEQSAWATGEASRNGSYSTFGDFDNDTRQDIFYAVDEEGERRVFIWHNKTTKDSSTFSFKEKGKTVLDVDLAPSQNRISWTGITTWDADNDGDMDLLIGWANHLDNYQTRPQFYRNNAGFGTATNLTDLMTEITTLPFTTVSTSTYTGGVAAADVNNDGLLDCYIVHSTTEDHKLYINNGGMNFTTYSTAISHTDWATGVTFGDVDNDGDQDMFLCNGGRLMLNYTNSNNLPAHRSNVCYRQNYPFNPPQGDRAQHYLDVMVSGAGADTTGGTKTKDGIGARVYVFVQTNPADTNWANYGADRLVGMREIDGGSGYGSQATQVQHFGLPTNLPGIGNTPEPHLKKYAVKVIFLNGQTYGKWNIVPDSVRVVIPFNNKQDTTVLDQTVEIWLGEKYKPPIAYIAINAEPNNTTITVDQSQTYTGTVYIRKQDGSVAPAPPYYNDLISWQLASPAGITPGAAAISKTSGSSTTFRSTEAYDANGNNPVFTITATVVNPEDPTDVSSERVTVTVIPGAAAQLVIEGSPLKPSNRTWLVDPHPLGSVTLSKTETDTNVYAIQRDQYGNWIGPVDSPTWASDNAAIATVTAGSQTSNGQGHITRKVNSGRTRGRATKGSLTGTVDIILEDVSYTRLRIVNAAGDSLGSLSMRTDRDTTLYAQGLNSATGSWDNILVTWSQSGLKIDPAHPVPTGQVQFWQVYPDSSGSGTITITRGGVSASIPVTFQKGPAASLVLFPESGTPGQGTNLPFPPTIIEDTAGQSLPIYARVFDANGEWLTEYASDAAKKKLIGWKVLDDENISRPSYLSADSSDATQFSATRAHHLYLVWATLVDQYGNIFADTIRVYIRPDVAARLYIEGDNNPRVNSPNQPNERSTVTLTSTILTANVYAVLRDRFGNYVSFSTATTWNSAGSAIATVAAGDNSFGEGVITKAGTGTTTVTAVSQKYPNLSDDVAVEVKAYSYTALRIVSGAGSPIDSLRMTTNDDTLLMVQGRRDDYSPGIQNIEWEPVHADWENAAGIELKPQPPKNAAVYGDPVRFSPVRPASGWIRVTVGNDQAITPDTVWVVFTAGAPLSVEFDIITPAAERIAGRPIRGVVRIKNKNGLVPGVWCYPGSSPAPAVYADSMGHGGRPMPTVTVTDEVAGDTSASDSTSPLNVDGGSIFSTKQCFNNGIDTVTFLLYYAPVAEDSLHKLTVTLGSLRASVSLRLLPGALDSLAIHNLSGEDMRAVSMQAPGDAITLVAVGYDAYGNLLGPVKSDWSVTDSLHAPSRAANTSQIYYTSAYVEDDEAGYLIATAVDTAGGIVRDSVWITIKPPRPKLLTAITRDYNGNGYLDAIELTFDRPLSLPKDFSLSDIYIVYYFNGRPVVFTVDSIAPSPDSPETTFFVLYLAENTSSVPGAGQTGWTPAITIGGLDEAEPITSHVSADGAPPVIWNVKKVISSTGDRTSDKVTVTFSEPIVRDDGGPLMFSMSPETMFYVWVARDGDTVRVDSLFAGIQNITDFGADHIVFFMTNGKDLNGNHLLSLKSDTLAAIGDGGMNVPAPNNQKVRVRVEGDIGPIFIGPNPMYPVFDHFESQLTHHDPLTAYQWAKNDGGAVMTAEILLSDSASDPDMKVTAAMLVFDAVGNLVYSAKNKDNIIPAAWLAGRQGGEVKQLVFYWNGITNDKRKAAPGIYRVFIYLDTKTSQKKYTGNVGIGR